MSELLLPSIMQSIKPKYCKLIASGKKTIDVQKIKPKIPTPFKVYIYETKTPLRWNKAHNNIIGGEGGYVIGEYVCDEIVSFGFTPYNHGEYMVSGDCENKRDILKESCLSLDDMYEYIGEEFGYARHNSDPEIFDKPKELNDFYVSCKGNGTADDKMCINCPYLLFDYDELNGHTRWCGVHKMKPLTRSPKSWCYVGFNDDTYIDLWQALQSGKFPIGLHKTNNHFFSLSNYTNEELNILLKNKEVVESFRRLGLMNIEQLAKDLAE